MVAASRFSLRVSPYGSLHPNVTSSIKPKVHNVSQCHKRTEPRPQGICTQKFAKIGPVVPEICSQTDRHTDRQTNSNTLLPYRGGINMTQHTVLNTHANSSKITNRSCWFSSTVVITGETQLQMSPCQCAWFVVTKSHSGGWCITQMSPSPQIPPRIEVFPKCFHLKKAVFPKSHSKGCYVPQISFAEGCSILTSVSCGLHCWANTWTKSRTRSINHPVFHRRVWYRALSLRYVCIWSSGIMLIP